ncbi:hypothetical protein BABINDRAFT_159543 [Babjeviella inositovora NRRL Y-12698]|uniref:Small nuclear ribonucleoprotein Sm D2 n=1 Tax=Babjeviella inositovora NRRL Y-12698 TaxID=984486 RepID=A0A1E3R150_9ASCO|nr:uncharacterized protein BABINDRAFT_159543 [Babjeviella inositovora NRRL Y-12698]ODQ83082.1 hypothetical protein BABINDRAFT_159543 [Babjeviella inositovora NRRL Y-12698]
MSPTVLIGWNISSHRQISNHRQISHPLPDQVLTSSELVNRPRSELNDVELAKLEEYEFTHGPMSILQLAVANHTPIIISCRNNHKLIARVKAFDRHCNMVLENVKELWTEFPRNAQGAKEKGVNKERFVSKMFLRGDSVVVVLKGA